MVFMEIYILDSGVDASNPNFMDKNGNSRVEAGWSYRNDDTASLFILSKTSMRLINLYQATIDDTGHGVSLRPPYHSIS